MASEEDKNNVISTGTKIIEVMISKSGIAIVGIVFMAVGVAIMIGNHWLKIDWPINMYIGAPIFVFGFIMFMVLIIIKMVFKHQEKMKGIK